MDLINFMNFLLSYNEPSLIFIAHIERNRALFLKLAATALL